jgi:hypothetical protein
MSKVNVTKFESVAVYIQFVCGTCPDGATPYLILADGESECLVLTPVSTFVEAWERMGRPVFIGVIEIEDKTKRVIRTYFPEEMPVEAQECFAEAIGRYLGNRTAVGAPARCQH